MPPPPMGAIAASRFSRLLDQLARAGRLAGDHPGVVIGVHEVGAGLLPDPCDRRLARRDRGFALGHLRSIADHRLLLGADGIAGHDDVARDAAPPCRVAERLCVVAGAVGRHALLRPLFGETEHGVARPARLEGPRLLEVLALEEQLGSGEAVQVGRGHHRSAVDMGRDPLACLLYVRVGRDMHGIDGNPRPGGAASGSPKTLPWRRNRRRRRSRPRWFRRSTGRAAPRPRHACPYRAATRENASCSSAWRVSCRRT